MKIPLKDLLQMRKEHNQIWPSDLVDDLENKEPLISMQSRLFDTLIAQEFSKRKEETIPFKFEENKSRLPSLVAPGWDNPNIKGTKNWGDFENLLLFYTIGKLDMADTPENKDKKALDLSELRSAIEAFLPLKGQKMQPAEERIQVNTTYLAFGKRTIDALLKNDTCAQYELEREIQDAEETNTFNAMKLKKGHAIASRVFKRLQKRYGRS